MGLRGISKKPHRAPCVGKTPRLRLSSSLLRPRMLSCCHFSGVFDHGRGGSGKSQRVNAYLSRFDV
jgi:hypothetical protein